MRICAVIVVKSKDMEQDNEVTININYVVETNGLAVFKFEIVDVKLTVKFSGFLFAISNQFTIIEIELKVRNVVLPESDPVTVIVYTISLAAHIESVDDTVAAEIAYEPAA